MEYVLVFVGVVVDDYGDYDYDYLNFDLDNDMLYENVVADVADVDMDVVVVVDVDYGYLHRNLLVDVVILVHYCNYLNCHIVDMEYVVNHYFLDNDTVVVVDHNYDTVVVDDLNFWASLVVDDNYVVDTSKIVVDSD